MHVDRAVSMHGRRGRVQFVQVRSWRSHVRKLSGFAARQAVHFCSQVIGGGAPVVPTALAAHDVRVVVHSVTALMEDALSTQLAAVAH